MVYIIAIAIAGLVALALLIHGARIRRIPERKDRAWRYFTLGAALMLFTGTLLVLQRTAL